MKLKYTIVALAATTLAANAAITVANYASGVAATAGTTGAADPTTQGWTANGTVTGFSHGLDSTIGGWRITDGTASQPYFYQNTMTVANASAMASQDWTATWTAATNADAVRSDGVPNGVNNYYIAPNQSRQNDNAMWIEVSGAFRYILTFKSDANDDLILSDGTTDFQITTANNQLSQELGTTVANYVTYTLNSVGGVVSLTDSLGGIHGAIATSGAASQDRVIFGAVSSGGQGSTTWNALDLQVVPEPSTTALLGLGGLALILRRRK